jgi:long-subunit fatty acid transport protein
MKLKISLILIVFILSVNNVFPQSKGTTSASFLKIAVGARNIAMGETGATSEDVNSIYWNPAGLNSLKEKEISLTHTMWFETINYEHIAGVLPMRYGNLGFGLNYLSMGDMDKYDNTGTKQNSKMSANDIALIFAYSRKNLIIKENLPFLNFGVNLKYLRSKLEDESATAIATDIGFQTEIQNPKLKFGLVFQNIGTKMKFIKESFSLPTNVKFGTEYSLLIKNNPLNLLLDINFPNDNNPRLNFGAEYVIRNWKKAEIFPRLGYGAYHKGFEDISGLSTGIGFKFENYTLDYAFVPYGELGNTHRISFSMKFGGKIKEEGEEKMEKVQEVFIKEQPKETELPQTVEESIPIVKPEEESGKELEEKIMSDLKLKFR